MQDLEKSHSFITTSASSVSCLQTQNTYQQRAYPPVLRASSGFFPILSATSKAPTQLFKYHSMMSPCPNMQAFDKGVYPPIVSSSTLAPALTNSSNISMDPTDAAQWRAVLPIESLKWIYGLQCRVAKTRLTEEMEEASMRRVCPECVRGVLTAW